MEWNDLTTLVFIQGIDLEARERIRQGCLNSEVGMGLRPLMEEN